MNIAPARLHSSNTSEKVMITKTRKDWIRSLFANSSSKKEAERRLAQLGLGTVQALQNAEISLEQSQIDLFNLKNYQTLRNQHSSRRLLEFMQWGMELEDVMELAPHGLQESYGRMIAQANQVIRQSLSGPKSSSSGNNGRRSSSGASTAPRRQRKMKPAKSR